MDELKPCPSCGGAASLISIEYDCRYFCVCDECNEKSDECYSEEEAIEAWNSRVKEEQDG